MKNLRLFSGGKFFKKICPGFILFSLLRAFGLFPYSLVFCISLIVWVKIFASGKYLSWCLCFVKGEQALKCYAKWLLLPRVIPFEKYLGAKIAFRSPFLWFLRVLDFEKGAKNWDFRRENFFHLANLSSILDLLATCNGLWVFLLNLIWHDWSFFKQILFFRLECPEKISAKDK